MVGRDPDRSLCSNAAPWTPRKHLSYSFLPGEGGWGQHYQIASGRRLPRLASILGASWSPADSVTIATGPQGPARVTKKTRPPGAVGEAPSRRWCRPAFREALRSGDARQGRQIFFARVFGVQA